MRNLILFLAVAVAGFFLGRSSMPIAKEPPDLQPAIETAYKARIDGIRMELAFKDVERILDSVKYSHE